tara:strand:- start:273 stop:380 length:108 start_codon:yes stop_codon:yes gene_type:complete
MSGYIIIEAILDFNGILENIEKQRHKNKYINKGPK